MQDQAVTCSLITDHPHLYFKPIYNKYSFEFLALKASHTHFYRCYISDVYWGADNINTIINSNAFRKGLYAYKYIIGRDLWKFFELDNNNLYYSKRLSLHPCTDPFDIRILGQEDFHWYRNFLLFMISQLDRELKFEVQHLLHIFPQIHGRTNNFSQFCEFWRVPLFNNSWFLTYVDDIKGFPESWCYDRAQTALHLISGPSFYICLFIIFDKYASKCNLLSAWHKSFYYTRATQWLPLKTKLYKLNSSQTL